MHELSVWEKESFFEQQDLIIIGNGFAGLWSARRGMGVAISPLVALKAVQLMNEKVIV